MRHRRGSILAGAAGLVLVVAVIPILPAASVSAAVNPLVAKPPPLTQGGTLDCVKKHTGSTLHKTVTMATGTSTSIVLTPSYATKCTLTGVIPSGWTVTVADEPITVDPGAGNAGTLDLSAWDDTFNSSCYASVFAAPTGFTNQGTLAVTKASGCGGPDGTVEIPGFVNTGTVSVPSGGTLNFVDASTTASTTWINWGDLDAVSGSQLVFSGQGGTGCAFGTVLVEETGSDVDDAGSVGIPCGGLTVDGGTTTGPIDVDPDSAFVVDFGATVPAKATGTVAVNSAHVTLEGTVSAGYTLSDTNTLKAATGAGNKGTLDLSDSLSGTGTFTNAGLLQTTDGGVTITFPSFINSGTVAATGTHTVSFLYDNGTTAGVISDTGTISATSQATVDVGPRTCSTGEDLQLDADGSIGAAGTVDVRCGALTLDGGTVSAAGPITVNPTDPSTPVPVTFDVKGTTAGAGGSADTVDITAAGSRVSGSIPTGWTLDVGAAIKVLTSKSLYNHGTVNLDAGVILTVSTIYNYGTVQTIKGAEPTFTLAYFVNESPGKLLVVGTSSVTFHNRGTEVGATVDFVGGTLQVATGATATFGAQNCSIGVTLSLTVGSEVENSGTVDAQCGFLTVDGGTVSSAGPVTVEPVGSEVVDFGAHAVTGAGGSADTVDIIRTGASIEGTIPSGWTVEEDVARTLSVDAETVNDGTVDLVAGKLEGTATLTNNGTVESAASVTITFPTFDNAGTVSAEKHSNIQFSYDNSGTAGTVDNTGTFSVAATGLVTVGPESCKTGEKFVQTATGKVQDAGSLVMQCGTLTIRGGTITDQGPIDVAPIGPVTIHYATGLAPGPGTGADTIDLTGNGAVFADSIPKGWPVTDTGHAFTMAPGAENDGTLTLNGFVTITTSKAAWINDGSIVGNGNADIKFVYANTAGDNTPTFTNEGTLSIGYLDGWTGRGTDFVNTGTLTLAHRSTLTMLAFGQTSTGTLNIYVTGTTYGTVYSGAGVTLGGTLNLVTTEAPAVGKRLFPVHWRLTQTGTFTTVNGLVINGTAAYQFNYYTSQCGPTTVCREIQLKVVSSEAARSLKASDVATPTPSGLVPGELLTSSFTVTNTGTTEATGGWEDSVYLATGTTYAPGDALLERIPHTTGLGPGASYTDSVHVELPYVPAGTYHLVVVPDSADTFTTDTFDTQSASTAFGVGTVPLLVAGSPVDTTLASGEDRYYRVTVSTQDVRVKVQTPAAGDADLYALFGKVAGPTAFSAASVPDVATPTATLTKSSQGIWYVDVHGDAPAASGASIVVSATLLAPGVTSISPAAAPADGHVTVAVRGAGFGSSCNGVIYADGDDFRVTSFACKVVNSTLAYISFTLHGATPALYTLNFYTDALTLTLAEAFTVEAPTTGGGLKVTISGGQRLRFGWVGPVTVTFTNTSGSDIQVPIVNFSAQNAVVALPGSSAFEQSVTVLEPDFSPPRGAPLPPGVLPPGATASLSFGILSTTTVSGAMLTAQVDTVNSTEHTRLKWSTAVTGYASKGGYLLLDTTQITADVTSALGYTDGAFSYHVPQIVATAAGHGVTLTNESQLFAYVVQEMIEAGAGAPVAGRVHLPAGTALSGAAVDVTSTTGAHRLYTGTSWLDGTFSIWNVPPGHYQISVPGYLPGVVDQFTVYTPMTRTNYYRTTEAVHQTLSVRTGATLSGTVTDTTTGKPVVGAVVTVSGPGGELTSTPTLTAGTYSVTGIQPGQLQVAVQGPGIVTSTPVTLTTSGTNAYVHDFSAPTGGSISGTVHPAADSTLPASMSVRAEPVGGKGSVVVGTVTPTGTFDVTGLAAGTYDLTLLGGNQWFATASTIAVSAGASVTGVSLSLEHSATVSGKVTDSVTGDPVSGATVSTTGPDPTLSTTTGATGGYTLDGVAPLSQTLVVAGPSQATAPTTALVTVVPVDPSAGQDLTENVALGEFGTGTVTVQTPTGAPLPDATVILFHRAVHSSKPQAGGTSRHLTPTNGETSFDKLRFGAYEAQVVGTTASATFDVSATALTPSVTITVPVATVTGTVKTAGGTDVAKATVSVSDATGPVTNTVTGATGAYTAYVTSTGSYTVTAVSPANYAPHVVTTTLTVGTTTTVTFSPGSASLTVTLTDGGGTLHGSRVQLYGGSTMGLTAPLTVSSGTSDSVTFDTLTPGTYSLSAVATGEVTTGETVTVATGANTTTLDLAAAGGISGTVSATGKPAPYASVYAVSGPIREVAVASTSGAYSFAHLAAGTYVVTAVVPTDAPSSAYGVKVTAGATTTTTTDISLTKSGDDLTVHEAAGTGGNFPAEVVSLASWTGLPLRESAFGPSTSAGSTPPSLSLGPLSPGTYTLVVNGQGRGTVTEPVSVPAGAPVTVPVPPTRSFGIPGPKSVTATTGASTLVAHERHAEGAGAAAAAAARPRTTTPLTIGVWSPTTSGISRDSIVLATAYGSHALKPMPNSKILTLEFQAQYLIASLAAYADNGCAATSSFVASDEANITRLTSLVQLAFQRWTEAYQNFLNSTENSLLLTYTEIVRTYNQFAMTGLELFMPELSEADTLAEAGALSAVQMAKAANLGSEAYQFVQTTGFQKLEEGSGSSLIGNGSAIFEGASTVLSYGEGAEPLEQYMGFLGGVGATIHDMTEQIEDSEKYVKTAQAQADNVAIISALYDTLVVKLAKAEAQARKDLATAKEKTNCPPTTFPKPTPPQPPKKQMPSGSNTPANDPNGITGPVGYGKPGWISPTVPIDYLAHFENATTAAVAAVEVKVSEPVPPDVTPTTVALTGFGYGYKTTHVLLTAGTQSFTRTIPTGAPDGDTVRVTASYDRSTNSITWDLAAINPHTGDVDGRVTAGFLPPDTPPGSGEGYVSFSAAQRPGLATGSALTSSAAIIFDRNEPITTPVWTNTVDANVPTATVTSLPATSPAGELDVRWSGKDGSTGGSGIASYDVYVSVNGGPLTLWQDDTTSNSADYDLTTGDTYGFAAVATNNVGTSGTEPASAQTSTTAGTTATTPKKPARPTAVAGNGAAKVSWSAPTDGGSPITGYTVTSSPTHKTCTTSGATTCTVKGLKNGTSYTFTLVARNAKGTSPASTPSSAVTPSTVPAAPGTPTAAAGNGSVAVSWSAPGTDGGSPITGYTVTSSPTAKTCTTSGATTCTVKGLNNGTSYTFTVVATNARGTSGPSAPSAPVTPAAPGYDLVGSDGGVFVFPTGQSGGYFGSLPGLGVAVDNVVGIVPTNDYTGYDLVGSDGGVFVFPVGQPSGFFGSLPGLGVSVNDIVGIVPTNDYTGYDLVGKDGGVFVFPVGQSGGFYGSLPGETVHVDDIVGIAVTGDDRGYWLAGSTGHVYNLGDAPGVASPATGAPIVGIAADATSEGGWLVANNGSVYPFGDAASFGTLPASGTAASDVVSIVPTPSGQGYWIIAADGRVFAFGDATSEGTLPALGVGVSDVVGAVPTG